MKSLIDVFGPGFPRLRIGIGRDRENSEAIAHVLGKFSADEDSALPALVDRCIEGIELWLSGGFEPAMNQDQLDKMQRGLKQEEPKDG